MISTLQSPQFVSWSHEHTAATIVEATKLQMQRTLEAILLQWNENDIKQLLDILSRLNYLRDRQFLQELQEPCVSALTHSRHTTTHHPRRSIATHHNIRLSNWSCVVAQGNLQIRDG